MVEDWDEFDDAAEREGQAILKSNGFRTHHPRSPKGVSKDDVKKESRTDLIKRLKDAANEK